MKTTIGDYGLHDVNRQIKLDIFSDKSKLYIISMDDSSAMSAGACSGNIQGEIDLTVVGEVATGADVQGNTRACVFDGTNDYLYTTNQNFRVTTQDFSVSMAIYQADWSSIAADEILMSGMDAAGNNGWKLYLKASDNKLHFVTVSGGADTSDLGYDSSGATAGYHTVGMTREAGVAQELYFDGVSAASGTDTTDTIGSPAASEKTITGVSNANDVVVSATSHGFENGELVLITGIVGTRFSSKLESLNNSTYVVANKATSTFELSGIDTSQMDAWTSGGVGSVTKPVNLEIGSEGGGQNKLTGRLDEIVLQIDQVWTANTLKILHNTPLINILIDNSAGDAKLVTNT